MNRGSLCLRLVGLLLFAILFGCGTRSKQKGDSFSVGGTLSGLASGASVVIQNNSDDDLTLTENGSFRFATKLPDGAAYKIEIRIQPEGQTCVVTHGVGNIEGADVTGIRIVCAGDDDMYSVGGTLSGLASGASVVLQNNGGDDLILKADGPFVFASKLADAMDYEVEVHTQPAGQFCSVSSSSGIISKSDVTDVSVVCADSNSIFNLSVTVTGLEGEGLVLRNNGGDDLEISNDGEFTFSEVLADGSAYNVTVATQPTSPDQHCTVTNGSGTIDGADVTDIAVSCVRSSAVSIGSFSVSTELVSSGDEVTLSWTTRNATSCTVNNGAIEAEPANMGAVKVAVNSTTEFTLECEGNGESVSSSPVTVYVTDADWVKVSSTNDDTCAIKRDGTLFCWGGDETDLDRLIPIPLQEETAANDWVDVSVGGPYCAIKSDGRLFCWQRVPPPPPAFIVRVSWPLIPSQESSGATDWVSVSTGENHVCAIKSDGRLFCWGDNRFGELGTNSDEESLAPQQEFTAATDWAQVSSGGNNTCAIKTDGRLFCWGDNSYGQLGNNSDQDSLVPVQEYTSATDWAWVAASGSSTCAIKTDGRLFCWGGNGDGRLGNNSEEESWVPVQEYTEATDWAEVATGAHTCGLKTDGRLFCWGRFHNGELGTGTTSTSLVPLQERTMSADWTQVTLGNRHTCALKDDGRLFCWGERDKCGNNVISKTILPLQDERGESDWAQVSVPYDSRTGSGHTCAVKTDGRLFCWGYGDGSQLGSNSVSSSSVPVQEYTEASDWLQVSAGYRYTCAVKTDGRLFCWGDNSWGQLGNNSKQDSLEPVQEGTAAADWAQVSAGSSHTCALKEDGRLFCWGDGNLGRLGNNSSSDSVVPVQEGTAATDWAQVVAGENVTRAIKTDGRLFDWGGYSNNVYVPVENSWVGANWVRITTECGLKRGGEIFCFEPIGNESNTDFTYPVQQEATAATDWVDVSTAPGRACAVKVDGRLFCWGAGVEERFGSLSTPDGSSVVQEDTAATDWIKVSDGIGTTCALKIDNRLFCWGYAGNYAGRPDFGPVWPAEYRQN